MRAVYLTPVALALFAAGHLTPVEAAQVVQPPQSQAWIDVATFSGFGMPGMGMGGEGRTGGRPMEMLGGLFGGGGAQKNSFGRTQAGQAGRWVDVTLYTRANPNLAEASQSVPAGFMAPALKLQSPRAATGGPPPEPGDERVEEREVERPKGRLLMYWGCGATVRPGQPKVLDMATLSPADLQKFFVTRRATQRGTHSTPGRPVWPQPDDARMVPAPASLVGEHQFSGQGVPADFRFQIPAQQDLMPPLKLQQQPDGNGATELSWATLPTARAYFIAGMGGAGGGGSNDAVFWTSSEQPDTGFGLVDYQTNPAVDRWLKEKVLLAPDVSHCTVPKGVFPGEGAMLRMIAYGSELNLAHPPRPSDPKVAWEPVWAVKLRVKSVTGAMLGMADMPGMGGGAAEEPAPEASAPAKEKKPKALDLLKGILGR
ncbi:hypothetical protein [Ideonella sp.]|uniref:hypothetical protein n=1 Tax=Ideonella sp. TaxID=1929293 RepID=UPI002B48AAC8|nr:hypothetical protein [Ideonella sp.]HJV71760.1 hypothetical protein [Ideonella sp.]